MVPSLSTILSTLSVTFHSERAELLRLLLDRGILYGSSTQPVLSRDGTSARWMLDSLSVTMTQRGAELAGRCLLELLKHFDGRQLATYGFTAIPILESVVLQSGGRYNGLLVRKDIKQHGSLKRIEGRIDPHEPTILIDDSISSGTSVFEGCRYLEEAGIRVEGAVCLVRFGWYGGYALLQERGYHVEAVYDIWDDFMENMPEETVPLRNPSKWFPKFEWSDKRAPAGLHPAQLARLALSEYFNSGKLLMPPDGLDADYDDRGGTWISVRSRDNVYIRHARDGFWHFPGETAWPVGESVIRAALRTAINFQPPEDGKRLLDASNIAVTFFSELEACTVGELDNDRYGIVVCSRERRGQMGGALPRMPGIVNEWEQFHHARKKNAQLVSFEPFVIYRHEVQKLIEPGAAWQPTGVAKSPESAWHESSIICGPVAARARDIIISSLFGRKEGTEPLPENHLSAQIDSLYVSVYIDGRLRGCMGGTVKRLDDDIRKLAMAALNDNRFEEASPSGPDQVAVSVSLLFNTLELGSMSPDEVASRFRLCEQALMVYQGNRIGLLLPFVAATHNLNRPRFVAEVIDKAGITRPPYHWCRFDCVTWLASEGGIARLEGGFPTDPATREAGELVRRIAVLTSQYLIKHQREDGSLFLRYEPCQNRLYEGLNTPRLAHAAWVLSRASRVIGGEALSQAAEKIVSHHRAKLKETGGELWIEHGDEAPSVAELSFLLLALCERGQNGSKEVSTPIAGTLWNRFDPHGRIATHRDAEAENDIYQDYFPGQVLLALAGARRNGATETDEHKLLRAFRYYRHRFRCRPNFGQVSWMMQAFVSWWYVEPDQEFAEFVFEIGDWILEFQQKKTGAFVNDHQSDTPGYTTALYLEGVGSAVRLAESLGDRRRNRYLDSYSRGMSFLDRLIIQERDLPLLPSPEFAIGGVRQSLYSSEVRIDFVQHTLSAILELYSHVSYEAGHSRSEIRS